MGTESTIRDDVASIMPRWTMIRDALVGASAIKAGTVKYLPQPNPTDDSEQNLARYDQYIDRAIWFDASVRTHSGLLGQIYYREPALDIPEGLLDQENIDGTRLGLLQQSRQACGLALAYGRAGLLTDYPVRIDDEFTKADEARKKPTITLYRPEQIINWRFFRDQLSLVVLKEAYTDEKDQFIAEQLTQYRVLSIQKGNYVTEIYRDGEVAERYEHRKSDGARWNSIPFHFIGASNNDASIDQPPMEGLATLNIGHYRNSADYEESCFMVGQPTPWGAGLTQDWVKQVWRNKFWLGSRAFVPLPEGGACGLLQAAPNTMTMEAMQHKERQMVALGAKLVENRSTAATATEITQDAVTSNSVLAQVADNVSAAYQQAIDSAADYAGVSKETEFQLNNDFDISVMSPQERQQLMAEWQGGGITFGEYRGILKRAGIATEEDEEAKAIIEGEAGAALNLGAGHEE